MSTVTPKSLEKKSFGKKALAFASDKAIMLCLLVMIIIIGIINPRFISMRVLRDVAMQNSTKLIMACGFPSSCQPVMPIVLPAVFVVLR